MKFIAQFLISLVFFYGAYQLYSNYAPENWIRPEDAFAHPILLSQNSDTSPAATPETPPAAAKTDLPPPPPAVPQPQTIHLVCPSCDGEGRITWADRNGANHSYACPICNTRGSKDLVVPPGLSICPDCKGWGRTEKLEGRSARIGHDHDNTRRANWSRRDRTRHLGGYRVSSSICRRCNTTGLINTRKPKPAGETPGVSVPNSNR
jgi:hypothetical protein